MGKLSYISTHIDVERASIYIFKPLPVLEIILILTHDIITAYSHFLFFTVLSLGKCLFLRL